MIKSEYLLENIIVYKVSDKNICYYITVQTNDYY